MSLRLLLALAACGLAACQNTAVPVDGAAPLDLTVVPDAALPPADLRAVPDLVASPDLTGSAITCGGLIGHACPAGMFCETGFGECCCDFQGVCVPIPQVCNQIAMPVCGCDGKTYANDCYRQVASMSPDHAGACGFPCGQSTCRADQICFQGCCGAAGCTPPPPTCQDAPAACNGHPTCACYPSSTVEHCQDLAGGGVLVTQMFCP
jgi:hypothetical protein